MSIPTPKAPPTNLASPSPRSPTAESSSEHPSPSPPATDAASPALPLRSKPKRVQELSEGRRPAIQFSAQSTEKFLRAESPGPVRPRLSQRLSSPPPPSTYQSKVSFDTFDNPDAADLSFSLRVRHKNYNYTSRSRTFLCGTDQNDYSEFALEWLLDELVDDGDEVVCLRVVDKDSKFNSDSSLAEQTYRKEAHKVMEHIQAKTKEGNRCISLTLEFAVGKVQDTIQQMIAVYEPACLVVGTRGRSLNGIQGLLPGSVSKYCLQNSPVPVIVVRPSSKREKKKQKRRADPSRRSYMEIVEKSGAQGSQVLKKAELEKNVGPALSEAKLKEAGAVANATGIPDSIENAAYLKNMLNGAEPSSGPDSPSPVGRSSPSPGSGVRMSPDLGRLESSDLSEGDELEAERRPEAQPPPPSDDITEAQSIAEVAAKEKC